MSSRSLVLDNSCCSSNSSDWHLHLLLLHPRQMCLQVQHTSSKEIKRVFHFNLLICKRRIFFRTSSLQQDHSVLIFSHTVLRPPIRVVEIQSTHGGTQWGWGWFFFHQQAIILKFSGGLFFFFHFLAFLRLF